MAQSYRVLLPVQGHYPFFLCVPCHSRLYHKSALVLYRMNRSYQYLLANDSCFTYTPRKRVSVCIDTVPKLTVICKSLGKSILKKNSWNSFYQGEVVQLAPGIPYSYGAESSEAQQHIPSSVVVHLSV